jgi:hypothetical protein
MLTCSCSGLRIGSPRHFTIQRVAAFNRHEKHTLTTTPCRSNGSNKYFKDVALAMLRTQLGSLTLAQDRYMNGTTTPVYLKFAKDKGFTPESITLPSGTQAHWFGNSSVKKILVYFHGMSRHAIVASCTDFNRRRICLAVR